MTQTYDANAAHQNAWARLVDENGDPLSIGGGTEYSEDAAAAANPAGGALILVRRDTLVTNEVSADGDNVAAKATNKGELCVNDLTANTALASALTALQIMDDWDESDRAKANIIVGQAGVAAGHGAVGATVQRVVSAGKAYETVAASQSAQVMGGGGATGDYLSHVNVQPTSTAPGVVTILDNAVEVHAYPGGTVAADLKPFTIPIDAVSVSGAWKITTGANVKVTAYGTFSA